MIFCHRARRRAAALQCGEVGGCRRNELLFFKWRRGGKKTEEVRRDVMTLNHHLIKKVAQTGSHLQNAVCRENIIHIFLVLMCRSSVPVNRK